MSYERVTKYKSQLIIGAKQTIKAMNNQEVKELFVAEDIDSHMKENLIETAQRTNTSYCLVDSKKKLGKACHIEVGASVVAIKYES